MDRGPGEKLTLLRGASAFVQLQRDKSARQEGEKGLRDDGPRTWGKADPPSLGFGAARKAEMLKRCERNPNSKVLGWLDRAVKLA